jgi:hypothetical protein
MADPSSALFPIKPSPADFLNLNSNLMKYTLISLLALITAVRATTIPFESQVELDAYTRTVTSNSTLAQAAAVGADSTGGLTYSGDSGATDRSFVAHRPLVQTGNIWTTSILLNARNFDALATDKCELRLGFATSTNSSSTKPHEFFHKLNPSISLRLNAENKTAEGKNRFLEAILTNRIATTGGETNSSAASVNNSIHFDDWLRVSLTIQKTGSDTFAASLAVDSLGINGNSAATPVLSLAPVTFTNAAFAAASTYHVGFTVKTEKALTTAAFLDDHSYQISDLPPNAPLANAASAIAATGLTAEWSAPSGVLTDSYTVELCKTSDNFAPNTLIAANGSTGQASGVSVSAPNLSLAFSGLLPQTSYSYRIIANNSAGAGPLSNVIFATTLSAGTNNPPTLDPIADQGPVSTFISPILIPLTGITAGGESGQSVTATVTPGNTAIIASGSVSAPDVSGNATLTLIPTGTVGTTAITVLLDDGQAFTNTFSRVFNLTIRNPLETLDFATATDLTELHALTNSNVTHAWFGNAGTGDPATGGVLVSTTDITGDRGFFAYRQQGDHAPGASWLRSSILINAANLDDIAPNQEAKIELRLGYTATTNQVGKPHEFLHKLNDSIHVSFKIEHKPSDASKLRKIEAELVSAVATVETKGTKLTLLNSPAVNDWLRLTLDLYPLGGNDFSAVWKIESLGTFGTDAPVTLATSAPFTITHATLAAATTLRAAYAGKFDKQITSLRLDDHRSIVDRSAPAAPVASAASLVTAAGFNANWQPGSTVPASSFQLEVVPDGSPFASGNYLAADGTTGQAAPITLSDGQLRTLRIENLSAGTTYLYRLTAINLNGSSTASNVISVTTLPPGVNAPPTLDAIANPAPIAINASLQSINLSGITSGGEPGQTLNVTAVSSNPSLIPHPTVSYSSPNASGILEFTPALGSVGTANITVTVNDGAPNNNTTQRVFKITVVDPEPMLDFNDIADFNALAVSGFAATLTHQTTGGTGTPSTGNIAFQGITPGVDRVAVAIRPTAYDASSAVHLVTSMDFKAADIFNATTGKEKGELRIGFMGENTANTLKPQDTLTKTHPSIALRFKVEHEPGAIGKERLLEGEVSSWTGSTELKDLKLSVGNFPTDDHWFRVTLTAVRTGTSTAIVSYTVDDMGLDGTTFLSRVIESGTFTVSNAAFFADNSVFAAATITDEKTSAANPILRADNYYAEVNTTAPGAPATQQASNITTSGFTVNWTAALGGNFATGFVIEIVENGDPFLPGNFISETGVTGQSGGILVEDAFAEDFDVSGLSSYTSYRVRVRAITDFPSPSESLALNSVFATTLAPPGLEYPEWRSLTFGANAGNESIAGPNAINNAAGIRNLIAYAFGLDPFNPDLALLPQADTSGEFLRITYRRRFNITGTTVIPTISSDLTTFHAGQVVIVSTSAPSDGFVTVVAEDQFPIVSNLRRFMRVEVTQLEP